MWPVGHGLMTPAPVGCCFSKTKITHITYLRFSQFCKICHISHWYFDRKQKKKSKRVHWTTFLFGSDLCVCYPVAYTLLSPAASLPILTVAFQDKEGRSCDVQ